MSEYISETYKLASLGADSPEVEAEAQNFLRGRTDGLEALRQTVYLLLQTEQGAYEIYPEFGVKLADLVGQPMAYVIPEVERRLREALLADERVLAVEDFHFCRTPGSGALAISFVIRSVYGELAAAKEVLV